MTNNSAGLLSGFDLPMLHGAQELVKLELLRRVRTCIKAKQFQKAERVLGTIESKYRVYGQRRLVDAYIEEGRLHDAERNCDMLETKDRSYRQNYLVGAYIRAKKFQEAEAILDMMESTSTIEAEYKFHA